MPTHQSDDSASANNGSGDAETGPVGASCWVDVCDPEPGQLRSLAERFGLHELAVEDAEKAHQRPKLERYGNTLLLVAKPAVYDDRSETIAIGELLIFIGADFLVSVRHGVAREVVRSADDGERQLANHEKMAVVHRLLDEVVDSYLPVASGLANDIREIEADVFSDERTNPTARIYRLKRQVLELLRNVEPLINPLDSLGSNSLQPQDREIWQPHDQDEYFRDVADHVRRRVAELNQSSALLSDVLQANLAQVSVAQNQDMRRISAWAAIFLVPSLLAAMWGMNFDTMPELSWQWGYPVALGSMLLSAVGLWFWFWHSGWVGRNSG